MPLPASGAGMRASADRRAALRVRCASCATKADVASAALLARAAGARAAHGRGVRGGYATSARGYP
jgi:hypothetical protein